MAIGLDTASLISRSRKQYCLVSPELQTSPMRILTTDFLLGLLAALVAVSVYLLIAKRHSRPLRYPIIIVATTMLIFGFVVSKYRELRKSRTLTTVSQHLVTDMQRILNAFIKHRDNPVAYLNSVSDPLYVLKSAFYVMQTLLGDGFVVSARIVGFAERAVC